MRQDIFIRHIDQPRLLTFANTKIGAEEFCNMKDYSFDKYSLYRFACSASHFSN